VKKIRVSLKRNKKEWSFTLFDSAESAFYLKDDILEFDSAEYYRKITLMPQEMMEVEWMGSEYIYSDEHEVDPAKFASIQHEKLDKIRFAKVLPIQTAVQKTGYVEIYSGWVNGEIFNWMSGSVGQKRGVPIKTQLITSDYDAKFDLKEMFEKRKMSEEEKDFENNFPPSPNLLN